MNRKPDRSHVNPPLVVTLWLRRRQQLRSRYPQLEVDRVPKCAIRELRIFRNRDGEDCKNIFFIKPDCQKLLLD